MQLKKSTIACAFALASVSGHAFAVAPGACAGNAFDLDIYLTGASAPQNILGGVMAEMLVPGFTVVADTGGGSSYRAYCGTLNNTNGSLSGKTIRFLHRAKGGSVWGVNPVARDQSIATLSFADADCTAPGGGSFTRNFDCAEVGDDLNPANPANRKPSFGVADVEPGMFKDPLNVEFGQTALSSAEVAKFNGTQRATNQVIFGVGASQNLVTAGGISDISRAQVAAILSGNYYDWNQVNPSVPAGSNTIVCRRVQGSGTQASFNAYFLNFPCTVGNIHQDGNLTPLRMSDSFGYNDGGGTLGGSAADPILIDPTAGPTYIENPSSGNVRSCLQAAKTNSDWAFRGDDGKFYKVQFSLAAPTALGHGAIGILSLDSAGSTNYLTDWSFLSLNGVSPVSNIAGADYSGMINAITGKYDFVNEQSIQWKNDKAFPAGHEDFFELFVTKAGQESILRGISRENVRAAVLAIPGLGSNTPTIPANPASNQTSQWSRGGNSCKPATLTF